MANNMIPPTQQPPINAMIPQVPPPSPALGFQAWASDPQNAAKVTHAMIAPNSPLQPNAPGSMASANPPGFKSPASLSSVTPPAAAPAAVTPTTQPNVQAAQAKLGTDSAELNRLHQNGAGLNQTKNPFLRGLEKAGDIVAPFILGGGAAAIPGTTLHNRYLQSQQAGVVGQDQNALKGVLQQQQVQTSQQQAQADLAKTTAETANIPQAMALKKLQLSGQLAKVGEKMSDDGQGNLSVAADESSPIYQKQLSAEQYMQAGIELRHAQTQLQQLAQQKYDPKSPVFQQAQQKLNTAQQNMQAAETRAQAYALNAQGGNLGSYNGKPLAGANLTNDGQTVGSRFAANVRPTGTQRTKADMANSAGEQLNDIVGILQKQPKMFGPGYGQSTEFKKWIGSQSPDAQRFLAARTIAADHLAATFGGRSEAALKALDDAIGQYKDNPQAALAGIQQLTKANTVFKKAGSFNTVGSSPSSGSSPTKADFVFVPGKGLVKQ